MFASKTTHGFYDAAIHGDNMPSDVVEITTAQHASLMVGQSIGGVISWDEDGYPFLTDSSPITQEQLQQTENTKARAYLTYTDWYVIRNQETGEAIPSSILEARATARLSVIE